MAHLMWREFGRQKTIRGVDLCAFGGGGASGTVDYPQYMKDVHEDWLCNGVTSPVPTGKDITSLMMDAIDHNPFESIVAYDPDTDIATSLAKVTAFGALDFDSFLGTILTSTLVKATEVVDEHVLDLTSTTGALNTMINAYSAQVQIDLTSKALPEFERGMQDINSVMSSAFVVGRALLLAEKDRNVAKYAAEQYMRAFEVRLQYINHASSLMLQAFTAKATFEQAVAHMFVEAYRIKMVAKKEEVDTEMHIEEAVGKWPLEAYHYGCNVMASIGSASVHTAPKANRILSALGGAASGASMGAQISGGNPIATGIGGIAGLLGGLG